MDNNEVKNILKLIKTVCHEYSGDDDGKCNPSNVNGYCPFFNKVTKSCVFNWARLKYWYANGWCGND